MEIIEQEERLTSSQPMDRTPEFDRVGSGGDRRRGVSHLEEAASTLMHAVQYLVTEQRAGHCTSVSANRQAIMMLCDSAKELVHIERREPKKNKLAAWLRSL